MRAPVFAGVTDGVGTTTLAVALHGVDGGRYDGRPVDVLVCRADTASFARAATTTGTAVLAVLATGPLPGVQPPRGGPPDPAQTWIDRLRPRFGAVVLLPYVGRWRGLDRPAPEVAGLLAGPAERRSPYADALLEITAALLRDGTLAQPSIDVRPAPPRIRSDPAASFPRLISRARVPSVIRLDVGGRAAGPARSLWRGLEPVERHDAPRVGPELDDEALEAEPVRTG